MPFNNIYNGKTVLVTGHTGFKGSWLTSWLKKLGADVFGISKDIPTKPSHFELANLKRDISHHILDIRDSEKFSQVVAKISPDFIFHLAAQPLVKYSYDNPTETFSTNVMGMSHVLEGIRLLKNKCVGVLITSDKCYDNIEISRGYHENDTLGGKDPYSASKSAAELVFKGYFHSYFKNQSMKRIATARAGNVIGGGDWAQDRIIPDCFQAWENNQNVMLRNPNSTRPWQHVLEPLSGYLQLGSYLWQGDSLNGQSYNFGPKDGENYSVLQLIKSICSTFFDGSDNHFEIANESEFHEASLLALDCKKAEKDLFWNQTLSIEETCDFTSSWYQEYQSQNEQIISSKQIDKYVEIAQKKGQSWAN